MFYSNIVLIAKDYVKNILLDIDEKHWYFYHNLWHTLDVFQRASYLTKKEGLNEELQEIIQLSALFHDTWFIKRYDDNEIIWANIAENFLKQNFFPQDKIDIVKNLILTTILARNPLSHLENIIKDADMDNLWRDDFLDKNNDLLKEFNQIKKVNIKKKFWLEDFLNLLENHKFYTNTQIVERQAQFEKNKKEIKKRLQNI